MNVCKLVLILMAGAILISSNMYGVQAKESGVETVEVVVTKPIEQLTKEDLNTYVELAIAEKVTVEQVEHLLENLSKEQHVWLDEVIASKTPIRTYSEKELEQAAQNERELLKGPSTQAITACDPAAQQQGFCWRQLVEYLYSGVAVEKQSPAWFSEYTTICDGDASDPDLVMYFNISSTDPDKLRWRTTSPALLFWADRSLNAFDFDNWGVHLCINTAVSSRFTKQQIADSIFIFRMQ